MATESRYRVSNSGSASVVAHGTSRIRIAPTANQPYAHAAQKVDSKENHLAHPGPQHQPCAALASRRGHRRSTIPQRSAKGALYTSMGRSPMNTNGPYTKGLKARPINQR